MKRICAVMIGLALLMVTPAVGNADATHQQAINLVIQRALSQRGVPFAYGGGTVSGPSLGPGAVDMPAPAPAHQAPSAALTVPAALSAGLSLTPAGPVAPLAAPAADDRVSRVGFDASGLIVYAFAG